MSAIYLDQEAEERIATLRERMRAINRRQAELDHENMVCWEEMRALLSVRVLIGPDPVLASSKNE